VSAPQRRNCQTGADTQVCPYVIAPLIQILARRSYNIKSDGK